MTAIVGAHAFAKRAVARRAAEALDPAVLIGRHGLRGELNADPRVLLCEDHLSSRTREGERRSDAADTGTDDEDVAIESGDQGGHAAKHRERGTRRPMRADVRPIYFNWSLRAAEGHVSAIGRARNKRL